MLKKGLLGLTLLMILLMVACGGEEPSSSDKEDGSSNSNEETFNFQISFNEPVDSEIGKAAEKFKESINEKTDGQIQVDLFPSGQLGAEDEVLENMSVGGVGMIITGTGMFGKFLPEYEGLAYPFLFSDLDQMGKAYDEEFGEEMNEIFMEDLNSRYLATWYRGPRYLTANKSITSPEDLDNMKLRTPANDLVVSAWKTLGANPTPMDFSELFIALQQGTVDGQENPLSVIYNNSFFEVQSHLMATEHELSPWLVMINEELYQSFPDDLQKVFNETLDEATNYQRELVKESESEYLQSLKDEGMEVIEVDKESFKKKLDQSEIESNNEDSWAPDLLKRAREVN